MRYPLRFGAIALALNATTAWSSEFSVSLTEDHHASGGAVRVSLVPACTSFECGLEWLDASFEEPDVLAVPPAAGNPNLFRGVAPPEGDTWWIVVDAGGAAPMAALWRPAVVTAHLPPPPVLPSGHCRVTVLDPQGKGLPGVRVAAGQQDAGAPPVIKPSVLRHWRPWLRPVRSDDKGLAVVPVPAGSAVQVQARAPGVRSAGAACRAGAAATLRLQPESPLAIELRDTSDQPLPGALVRDQDGLPVALGDDSGRLELDAALARSLRLWFELPSGAVLEAAGFDAAEEAEPEAGAHRLRARPLSRLRSGTVAVESGPPPVSPVFVWREPEWPWTTFHHRAATALRQAPGLTYAIHALPQERLWFAADGFGHGRCRHEEARGRGTLFVDARLCPPVLRPAREIAGLVVDEAGAPVTDADVWLQWSSVSTILPDTGRGSRMLIRTGPDGAFAARRVAVPLIDFFGFRADSGFPSLYLRAEAAGYLPVPTTAFDRLPLGPAGVEVQLRRGSRVTGRVVDGVTGSPLAGAEVGLLKGFAARGRRAILRDLTSLDPNDGRFAGLRTARTDASGVFGISALPGRYDLIVRAPDRAFFARPDTVVGTLDVDFGTVVLTAGRELVGEVVDRDRRPVAGARILAAATIDPHDDDIPMTEAAAGTGAAVEVRTDTGGRFRLGGLTEDTRVDLEVSARGMATEFLFAAAPTGEGPLQIVLDREAVISGRVTHNGDAVSTWVSLQGPSTILRQPIREHADAAGRFRFRGLRESRYDLAASGGRRLEEARTSVTATAGDNVDVALELGAAQGRLAGRVTADGTGLPGIVIRTRGRETITDAGGNYSMAGLRQGPLWVTASRPGLPVGEPHAGLAEQVQVGTRRARLDFDFSAFEISGRALRADGSPAAGVELWFSRRTEAWSPGVRERTDRTGAFAVRLLAGTWDIGTSTADGTRQAAKNGFKVGRPRSGVVVRLPPSGFGIEGVVHGLDAEELRPLVVEARSEDLEVHYARVDATGRFRIEGLGKGAWLVVARVRGQGRRAERRVRISDGDASVELEFRRLPRLQGVVTLDGRPLGAAPILLVQGRDLATARRTWSRHDGSWAFPDLEPGDYSLGAGAEIRAVSLQSDEFLTFDLASAKVSGTVRDPSTSAALAGATVTLWPRAARRVEAEALGLARQAVTDDTGTFVFREVPAGSWSARVDGRGRGAKSFDLAPGATASLRLP